MIEMRKRKLLLNPKSLGFYKKKKSRLLQWDFVSMFSIKINVFGEFGRRQYKANCCTKNKYNNTWFKKILEFLGVIWVTGSNYLTKVADFFVWHILNFRIQRCTKIACQYRNFSSVHHLYPEEKTDPLSMLELAGFYYKCILSDWEQAV